jgi:putative ABC transport system ATP-binding protein
MLEAVSLVKRYSGADKPAVRHLDLHVRPGEFLAVTGRSGSGKSTLLHMLSSLIKPDSGRIFFRGADICAASEDMRNALRGKDFAVVFQRHHLLPYLSALENVLFPFLATFPTVKHRQITAARTMLKRVAMGHKEKSLPGELSGGERQRVAIARALARGARILFADEPTGSLDSATGTEIMELLHELNADGLTIVMVTHNDEFAGRSSRVIRMADGEIVNQPFSGNV